jgi:hypothetical protein
MGSRCSERSHRDVSNTVGALQDAKISGRLEPWIIPTVTRPISCSHRVGHTSLRTRRRSGLSCNRLRTSFHHNRHCADPDQGQEGRAGLPSQGDVYAVGG